jgi:hypothetical protein
MNIESMSDRELDQEANYLFRCFRNYRAYQKKLGSKAKSQKKLGQMIETLSAENRKRLGIPVL